MRHGADRQDYSTKNRRNNMAIIAGLAGVFVFIFALILFLIIGWGWNALLWAWVSGIVAIIIFLIIGRKAPRYFDDDE